MPSQRVELRFPGTHEGFEQAFERLRQALDAERLQGAPRFATELVFEEVVANIINHGAVAGTALDVRVTLEAHGDSIVLTFDDDGVAFDPRGRAPPAPLRLDEERIGGFGLVLVRHAARSLDYERTGAGRNRLTITLQREAAPVT
jgi:anti-sigma regulatory factor (Ser/Thr protein kinase)